MDPTIDYSLGLSRYDLLFTLCVEAIFNWLFPIFTTHFPGILCQSKKWASRRHRLEISYYPIVFKPSPHAPEKLCGQAHSPSLAIL